MSLTVVVVALISLVTVANSGNSLVSARQLPQAADATCNVTIPNGCRRGFVRNRTREATAMLSCQSDRLDCGQTELSYSSLAALASSREKAHSG